MHWRKIGFVEGQQQGIFVNVQQVLVGSFAMPRRKCSASSSEVSLLASLRALAAKRLPGVSSG
jgi:hypothetical protein